MTPQTRTWLVALLLCTVGVGAQSSCTWPASFFGGPAAGVTWSAYPAAPIPDVCIAVSARAALSRRFYRAHMGLIVPQSSGCGGGLCDSPSSPTTHSSLASIVCPAGWFGSAQAQCEATRMCERADVMHIAGRHYIRLLPLLQLHGRLRRLLRRGQLELLLHSILLLLHPERHDEHRLCARGRKRPSMRPLLP